MRGSRGKIAKFPGQLSARVFLRELRLPVLGGVEDVQDARRSVMRTCPQCSCPALLSEVLAHLLRWNTLAGVDLSSGSIDVGKSFRCEEVIELLGFLS